MSQLSVSLRRTGATASEATIRSHEIVMDRPEDKGGGNLGPMGGETLLAALGGCFMSTLVAAAQARSIEVGDAECTVIGEFAESPRRFGGMTIEVRSASIPPGDLEHLVQVAERGCLVAATLRQGIPVTATAAPTKG